MIFTDTKLPDGTWIDVVNLIEKIAVPICIILVGPSKNREMYQAALNYGAYDCTFPPCDGEAVSQLLTQAMVLVRSRRERSSHAAVA